MNRSIKLEYDIITTLSVSKQEQWKIWTKDNEFDGPFGSFDFLKFTNTNINQKGLLFAAEKENEIKALCIVTIQKENGWKGFFSKRAIIYGGPIIVEQDEAALKVLLENIYNFLRYKVIYIEIRNLFDYSRFSKVFNNCKWSYLPYLNFQLSLVDKSVPNVLKEMKYNRRREIRQSLEEGANYNEANDLNEIQELYAILKTLYKTKVKLPFPDLNYFINLFKSKIGKVFVVKHNKKIIGGSFCFYTDNKTIYTLYYCGIRDYNKKIFPTHLAILAAIEFGINKNLKKIDFMGAGMPGQEYGVRKYKEEFGGDLVEYGRFIKICKPFLYNIGKLGLLMMKKIK